MGVNDSRGPLALAVLCALAVGSSVPHEACADGSAWRIHPTPAVLRLGTDRDARLDITGPDVPLERVELMASVGTLRSLTRVGPGHFTAHYTPPSRHVPDVAVLAVRSQGAWDLAGAVIPMAGRYHLSVQVEPSARVTLDAGDGVGRQTVAPRSGRIDALLPVMPGIDRVRVVATDRSGNRTETSEMLRLAPGHRVLLLNVPVPDDTTGLVRWIVVASTPTGTWTAVPPGIDVGGAAVEVHVLQPGIFLVSAQAPRHATTSSVRLTVTDRDVMATPDHLDVVLPPARPRTMELVVGDDWIAGQPTEQDLWLRDDHESPVGGLASSIHVWLDGQRVAARMDEHEGRYTLHFIAPQRVSNVWLQARLDVQEGSLSTSSHVHVRSSPPERLAPVARTLAAGTETTLDLHGLDRFGNAAVIGHPEVRAVGAHVLSTVATADAVRVRLVPVDREVHLAVRGDYDFHDRVDLVTGPPVLPPISVGVALTLRSNFGALVFVGGRLSGSYQTPIGQRLRFFAAIDAGGEFATLTNGSGNTITIGNIPIGARTALLFRFDPVEFGPEIGAAGAIVLAQLHGVDGDLQRASGITPLVTAGLLGRGATAAGTFAIEIGGQVGTLDTLTARGNLGGIFGALGWSTGF